MCSLCYHVGTYSISFAPAVGLHYVQDCLHVRMLSLKISSSSYSVHTSIWTKSSFSALTYRSLCIMNVFQLVCVCMYTHVCMWYMCYVVSSSEMTLIRRACCDLMAVFAVWIFAVPVCYASVIYLHLLVYWHVIPEGCRSTVYLYVVILW